MARSDKDSELVFGIISTVGTDTRGAIEDISKQLHFFRYTVTEIRVSKQIISQFEAGKASFSTEFERVNYYMDLGNKIRKETKDQAILMKGVAREIFLTRTRDDNGAAPLKRHAFIINSLKNSEEVEFMRDTYGDAFHLIGITSSYARRIKCLTERDGMTEDEAKRLLARDEDEDIKQGQHTRDAFQHADYFIEITGDADKTYNYISRLIDLLFGNPFISPTFDEYAMFMAFSSSLRSADLSRQVGAVVTKNNEIIAMGVNDCPKAGGGLYWPEETEHGMFADVEGGRDYTLGYDSNKKEQERIIQEILSAFRRRDSEENILKLKKAGIGDLTEYGRVVHAEMEALLSCARNNVSTRDATMYVTTFPCHNCAKHIIAAGIKKVVYIEPYPKSKAFSFYPVEISDNIPDDSRVVFTPFVGVGPQRFVDLFSVSSTKWYERKRKEVDKLTKKEWDRGKAELRNPISLVNYLQAEENALMAFEDEMIAVSNQQGEVL